MTMMEKYPVLFETSAGGKWTETCVTEKENQQIRDVDDTIS